MISAVAAAGGWLLFVQTCAVQLFILPGKRPVIALKNRIAVPSPADYDSRVTLDALLASGDDTTRWSSTRAAAIEGYVVAVHEAGPEAANCYSWRRRDTHIEVARRLDAPPHERVVVEVTPRVRDRERARGRDWSTAALRAELLGRWSRIEGWLMFDPAHADESLNTRVPGEEVWRATAWEIHPVTSIVPIR